MPKKILDSQMAALVYRLYMKAFLCNCSVLLLCCYLPAFCHHQKWDAVFNSYVHRIKKIQTSLQFSWHFQY